MIWICVLRSVLQYQMFGFRKKQWLEELAWSKAVNILPCKNRHIILFWIYSVDSLTVLRLRILNSPSTH